jgi:hypothetical protein
METSQAPEGAASASEQTVQAWAREVIDAPTDQRVPLIAPRE